LRFSNGRTAIDRPISVIVPDDGTGGAFAILRSLSQRPVGRDNRTATTSTITVRTAALRYQRRRELTPIFSSLDCLSGAERAAEECSEEGAAPLRHPAISSDILATEEYLSAGSRCIARATIRSS